MEKRFLFIGGDKRILYAAEEIAKRYTVHTIGLGESEPNGRYDFIILPLPISRDGVNVNTPLSDKPLPFELIGQYAAESAVVFGGGRNSAVEDICRENGLRFEDYFADEPLTLKNAVLTAEAAAAILAQCNDSSLFGAKVLITGGGRVAVYTARLMKAFGSNVTVCARSAEQRAKAELEQFSAHELNELPMLCASSDFIINTVPAELFDETAFSAMKRHTVYMELATMPPEPRKSLAEQHGVQYIHAAGLPGKASPKTAGQLIAKTISLKIDNL